MLEAAVTALTSDQSWIKIRNKTYQQRRDIIIDGLKSLGIAVQTPSASLYIWCPIPNGWTSVKFTSELLDEAYLSLTPGIIFGSNGEGYVRISLAAPTDVIQQAVERLVKWWRSK
jgi:LL-diaminopimelate aminotransferase